MLLLTILRFFFSLLSWALIATAAYLLWRWSQGTVAVDAAGRDILIRDPWMLWVGILFGAWSLGGRFFWTLILARRDDTDLKPTRGQGVMLDGWKGAKLYVEHAGAAQGPTLVFTHGSGTDSTAWYLAKQYFGDEYRVVTWDMPGLGKSTGEVSLESYAENLRIVVQSVAPTSTEQKVIVIGHSMGGMAIQTLAMRHPDLFGSRIVGTALLNTTYTNPLRTMILSGLAQAIKPVLTLAFYIEIALFPLAWISAWQSYLSGSAHIANRITFGRGVTRRQLDHIALLGTRNNPASIARGNLSMINWDATGAVANIPGRLLIVAGGGDIVTKPDASIKIASMAIEPELERESGANHMSFLDHAGDYHRHIELYASMQFVSLQHGRHDRPRGSA